MPARQANLLSEVHLAGVTAIAFERACSRSRARGVATALYTIDHTVKHVPRITPPGKGTPNGLEITSALDPTVNHGCAADGAPAHCRAHEPGDDRKDQHVIVNVAKARRRGSDEENGPIVAGADPAVIVRGAETRMSMAAGLIETSRATRLLRTNEAKGVRGSERKLRMSDAEPAGYEHMTNPSQ